MKTSFLYDRIYSLVLPVLTFLAIMGLSLLLVLPTANPTQEDLRRGAEAESRKVVGLIEASLRERVMTMEGFAHNLSFSHTTLKSDFQDYSRHIMGEFEGMLAIIKTDRELEPVWLESGSRKITLDSLRPILNRQTLANTYDRIIRTREYAISDSFQIPTYGTAFATVVPFYRDKLLAGFAIGVFLEDTSNLHMMPDLLTSHAQLRQVSAQDLAAELIPSRGPGRWRWSEGDTDEGVIKDFIMLGSQRWEVLTTPKSHAEVRSSNFASWMILILGTILALIVSTLLYRHQAEATRSKHEARSTQSRLVSTTSHLATIEEELDLILNNVDDAIVLYDEQLSPLQANDAFKRSFGALETSNRLGGNGERHHQLMASRFQNESQYRALLNTLRENPEKPATDEVEVRRDGKDHSAIHYQRRATAVCTPNGDRRGFLVIYHNVTPQRAVERLKEDFLSSVTHDLRTPLSAIRGSADTMLRNTTMDESTREEFTRIIRDESTRLQEMIEDLLDLRRMEDGQIDLAPACFFLRDLVEDVVRSLKPTLEAGGIEVEIEWTGGEARAIAGDFSKIGRAVRNILGNAIKYTPARGVIRIEGDEGKDRVELRITDEGPGIPPADIPHVFEKFYRGVRHARRTQGTGLGLAIVKHIIESHGGVVSASNGDGGGASIRMVLPRETESGLTRLRGNEASAELRTDLPGNHTLTAAGPGPT